MRGQSYGTGIDKCLSRIPSETQAQRHEHPAVGKCHGSVLLLGHKRSIRDPGLQSASNGEEQNARCNGVQRHALSSSSSSWLAGVLSIRPQHAGHSTRAATGRQILRPHVQECFRSRGFLTDGYAVAGQVEDREARSNSMCRSILEACEPWSADTARGAVFAMSDGPAACMLLRVLRLPAKGAREREPVILFSRVRTKRG